MIAFLDSSVLVSALAPDETHHEQCLALLLRGECVVYSHAFLETFSSLTGGRLGIRVDAELAAKILKETVLPRVRIVELVAPEILDAVHAARKHGVRGGAVYDYMHLVAARKAGVDTLYTTNLADFRSLHRPGDPEIRCP